MLAVLSPAKKLDFSAAPEGVPMTEPRFLDDTAELVGVLRGKSVSELAGLMSLSDNLATLNHERYATFDLDSDPDAERKQAVLAFAGDTYVGLDAPSLTAEDLAYADGHLRILSGLYGVLRPTDLIQPHRLEMGTKLATDRGDRLYAFWGPKIAERLSEDLGDDRVLLNLASVEYASSIDRDALDARVITPKFMEVRDGTPKVISFVAKKSRGAMARWMLQERPGVDDLTSFDVGGYAFDESFSSEDEPAFIRS
ncbi:MAG: peroxide stress protein YaaA [Acidimicrobiia bacterium]|jgi:cytoplasmic iron level regulating protein YaaA (DUF328/UPF0246 family)|nr:MAG: peroxide stress protein YaaA [Acidimicrobiia bacterium]